MLIPRGTSLTAIVRLQPEMGLLVWGFPLSLVWEIAQTPLYADRASGWIYLVGSRLHCSLGDILILLGAYELTALVLRDRRWPSSPGWFGAPFFTLLGVGYTVWSEWFNVHVARAWGYASAMPTVWGIGLAPLLQWLVIPPIVALLVGRRLTRVAKPLE